MERYIGIDVHAMSCTIAVLGPSGRRLRNDVVETNGRALVSYLKLIPGDKHVVMEEGTQSEWLYEILRPHVVDVVVTLPGRSFGSKSDKIDASALAEGLRIGAIKRRVHKDIGAFGRLRELARVYIKLVQDHVRAQNRLHAIFRSRGETSEGLMEVKPTEWVSWAKRLPARKRDAAEMLFDEMQAIASLRQRAESEMLAEAKKHQIWRMLQTCPGLGPIRTAQLISIVMSPARFRTSRQFWAYCGLAVVTRSSDDWSKTSRGDWHRKNPTPRGLNRNHNHVLKEIFAGAAQTVAGKSQDDSLRKQYDAMITRGLKPPIARITLARKIAAIVLAMWKTGEAFNSAKHQSQK